MSFFEFLFLILVFVTHTIQGAMGFGGTMIAMPVAIRLVGGNDAKVVLDMIVLCMSIIILVREYRYINFRELFRIISCMLIGMAAGVAVYSVFPLHILLKLYGILVFGVAVKHLFLEKPGDKKPLPTALSILILLCAGIIHGMFVSGGALLTVYSSRALGGDKREFRATISAVWTILDIILLLQLITGGMCTGSTLRLAGLSVVPLVLALIAGDLLHRKMNQKMFIKVVYVLMAVAGLSAVL